MEWIRQDAVRSRLAPAAAAGLGAWSLLLLFRHGPWFDEIQAWQIASSSANPIALFRHLKYEGHPMLWHLVLWAASFVDDGLFMLTWVHVPVTLVTLWLILVKSPFSGLEKVLICANFFVIFDTGMITRPYCLGLMLVLLYAWLITAHPQRLALRVGILAALANLTAFSAMLSLVLLAGEQWFERADLRRRPGLLAFYTAMFLVAVATMAPASDFHTGSPIHTGWERVMSQVRTFTSLPLLPALAVPAEPDWLPTLGAWLLVGPGFLAVFGRSRPSLLILGATAALFTGFGIVIFEAKYWHGGVMFAALLLQFWRVCAAGTPRSPKAVMMLFGPGAVIGLMFAVQALTVPYAHSASVARWLERNAPPGTLIMGAPGLQTAVSVGAALGRPLFDPGCQCYPKLLKWAQHNRVGGKDFMPAIVGAMRAQGGGPALLVVPYLHGGPLIAMLDADPRVSRETVAEFTGAMMRFENFAVLRLTLVGEPGAR